MFTQKAENSKNVKIGSMIAVMVEEGEDWQNAEIPESSESSPEASTSSEPSSAASAGKPTARFIFVLNMHLELFSVYSFFCYDFLLDSIILILKQDFIISKDKDESCSQEADGGV